MSYMYFAYMPIGQSLKDTTCLLRYKRGKFESYQDGKWIDADGYFSIFVGENDNFERIFERDAEELIKSGIVK